MSLNLKISQRITLTDTIYSARPFLTEPTDLSITSYTSYQTGDKEILDAGESITISPMFISQYMMITSSLLFDVTVTQPGYTRVLGSVTASFPETTFQVTSLQNYWTQFGIFSEIIVTSKQNGNKIYWFAAGNDQSELPYITIDNSTLTTPSTPYVADAPSTIPIFDVPFKQYIYVVGDGGPVSLTANPALTSGYYLNQQVAVIGTSDTDTVTIDNGLGTSQNGFITLGLDDAIDYYWNGSYWSEESRR